MKIIKIFGPGCYNCQRLEESSKRAVAELGLGDVKIEHVRDMDEMIKCGVMATPAISVNGEIMASGRIPEASEIKSWLG